jgi:hypothetical protein
MMALHSPSGGTIMIQKMTSTTPVLLILSILISAYVSACSGTAFDVSPSAEATVESSPAIEATVTAETMAEVSPTAGENVIPDSALDGRSLLETRCTQCHNLNRVENTSKTLEQWRVTVERMVNKGADLNRDEQETLIQYLAETYP